MRFVATLVLACALGLTACGGSGGSPPMPQLRVSAQSIKTLAFHWQAVPGATLYRLLEDRDGDAGPQADTLLAELPADQLDWRREVFLPERVNARYRLQACRDGGCWDSVRVGIEGINQGIGYFKASNAAAQDQFGEGLALSADGRFLAVGAYGEDGTNEGIGSTPVRGPSNTDVGAVYVFHRAGTGWVQEAYLKPGRSLRNAQFGYRLALSGDGHTLLVGSPTDDSGGSGVGADPDAQPGVSSSGAAYVFDRDAAGGWTQTSYIKATAPEASARFGEAVSLSTDAQWLVVGQPYSSDGGRVALYRRGAAGWAWQTDLTGSNTEPGDQFGLFAQLNADGRTLVVGAPYEDGSTHLAGPDNAMVESGAVYLFQRDSGDAWSSMAYLKSPTPTSASYFGFPVAISGRGDTIAVGESYAVTGPPTAAQGQAHIFSLQGANWVHERAFTPPLPAVGGHFGEKLALSADGTTLAVSNPYEDANASGLTGTPVVDGQATASGSVSLYRRDGSGAWSSPVYIKAPNNQPDLYFGWSLSLSASGDTLAVYGSDYSTSSGIGGDQSDRSGQWTGAVYLY